MPGKFRSEELAEVSRARAFGDREPERDLDALREKFPVELMGGRLPLEVSGDPPVQALEEAAQQHGAYAVVVGSHGRGGLARFLGSLADPLSARSSHSVLISRGL